MVFFVSLGRLCVVPVDVVAHAGDEPGQEHERLPVWRLFTRDSTHVAVGPAVALRHTHTGSRRFVFIILVIIFIIVIIIAHYFTSTVRKGTFLGFPDM